MCTRYAIINRVSELKVHIKLTRFVQPEKIEIDANERAVNEKSPYCFFVCTTFDSFLNDLSNSNPHYILKITALYITFATIQCRYFYFLRYTKPNIFLYTIISYTEFDLFSFSGLDGSRTRVQKPIPCPSTSVVHNLTFPLQFRYEHRNCFSSFIIRPRVQSFARVVSHIVEAWVLKCECSRSDCCH